METFSPKQIASFVNLERLTNSFVEIVKIDTGSDEALAPTKTPSTDKQFDLARFLMKQLKEDLKLEDVELDEHCILMATLPSNIGSDKNLPVLGLMAHMDTSFQVPTGPVKPIIHKNYQGGKIELDDGKVAIQEADLKPFIGEDIITSDGTTLLGSDDKSGIAEILEAIRIVQEKNLPHPKIRLCFTPDEETATGVYKLNLKKFGVDFAYTVDGDTADSLEIETWNAFNPVVTIRGVVVHAGHAYGKMVNSALVAAEFISSLPPNETPATTRGREGFYHVRNIKGDETETKIEMLARDFDYDKVLERVKFLEDLGKKLQKKYEGPDGRMCKITVEPKPSYRNMKENLMEVPQVIDFALEAIKRAGHVPKPIPVRGGTDGAKLTMKGLLTPNLGSGAFNFHALNEFCSIQEMGRCCEVLIQTLMLWAEKAKEMETIIEERRKKIAF